SPLFSALGLFSSEASLSLPSSEEGACGAPPMATGVAAPRLVASAIAATWLASRM
ncbi:hypothetical protein D046_3322B, partial [Vibrio parahaemolyticus V-223/04]